MKGKFLVRAKGTTGNDFVVSVIYKKEATHHNLVREAEGEEFKLNKVPTGCTTIHEVGVLCLCYVQMRSPVDRAWTKRPALVALVPLPPEDQTKPKQDYTVHSAAERTLAHCLAIHEAECANILLH